MEEIPGEIILRDHFPSLPLSDVLKLEGIANRDSLPYAGTYDLGSVDRLRSLVRGTVRYGLYDLRTQAGCIKPSVPDIKVSQLYFTR